MMFDAHLITRQFFPQYIERPWIINNGRCMEWAYIAHLVFDKIMLYDTYPAHVFVKHDNTYFDSERPNGVSDWQCLPAACARANECEDACICVPTLLTTDTLKQRWHGNRCKWDELSRKAQQWLTTR